MARSMCGWTAALLVALPLAGCSDDAAAGPHCSLASLVHALEGAAPGATIEIGACAISGSVTVPPGVTLRGVDATRSSVAGTVQLAPGGDRPTTVESLAIESPAGVGLRAEGPGAVSVDDVTVRAAVGYGAGFVGLDVLGMSRVTVLGPVTRENATRLDPLAGNDQTATYGIAVSGVGIATLRDVSVAGFARVGAAFADSTTTWTGGGVSESRSVGLMVVGGVATLESLELRGVFQGGAPIPAYGGVFVRGADVRSSALTVREGDGIALMHSGARGAHVDLAVTGQTEAAVWAQLAPALSLTRATLSGNGVAGLVAVDSDDVSVEDSQVTDTQEELHLTSSGAIRLGDGVQLVASPGRSLRARIRAVRLEGNARVGLLADAGGGDLAGVELADVTVDGTGDQLGVIGQGAPVPAAWSGAVMRLGATPANDEVFAGHLDVTGAVDPCALPPPDELMAGLDGR